MDFIQLFGSNSTEFPFTKFKLGSFDPTIGLGKVLIPLCGEMTKEIDLHATDEIHYLENVSPLLQSFPELEYFKMPRVLLSMEGMHPEIALIPLPENSFKLFSDSEVQSLKNLKTLEVENEFVSGRAKYCPTFFEELLSAAENISTILASDSENAGLELLEIFEKLGREPKLKILSLRDVLVAHLKVLKKMVVKKEGLRLKHLSIEYGKHVRHDIWRQLFELMKESLVSLRINHNFVIPTNFPRMTVLKLLDLKFVRSISPNLNDFSNSFPALQSLRLSVEQRGREEGHELDDLDEFYIGSLDSCPLMESLSLENFVVNIRALEQTLDVFPHLKELEINITVDGADILQMIWAQMIRLVKLKIYCRLARGNNVESLMTGISADGIKKIRGNILSGLKDMRIEERNKTILSLINEYRTHPSIWNLTNLKYLTLNILTNGGRCNANLSDLTGYFGFYLMKTLRQLNISECMISKFCSEILVSDLELDSWKFQSPGELEIIPSRWDSNNHYDWNKLPSLKSSFN